MGGRRLGWRLLYEAMAARVRRPEWSFMNYGYAPSDTGTGLGGRLELAESDESDRLSIQLYRRAIGDAGVRGADVLEVGSGRGGGASYVARCLEPRSMTGLDFSRAAVALCRKNLLLTGLSFVHGDALAMPFPDESFDVVLNIESSHCYDSMETFLAEVHRVLRPGGTFCWVDLRGAADVAVVRRQFAGSALSVLDEQDITDGVLRALRLDDGRKVALIENWFPRFLHPPLHRFAGTARSSTFDRFEKGELRYLSARATRTAVGRV
jgi:SAM-dependent methyltransferase